MRDLEDLHYAIGQSLAEQSEPLQPQELRWFRLHLDLTQDALAELLISCDSQTVAQWERREGTASEINDRLIRLLYLGHINNDATLRDILKDLNKDTLPPPDRWTMAQAV